LEKEGKGFTYANTASLLNVKKGRVENWLKGQRPSADDLQNIGETLGLSADWLLYGEGDPEEGMEAHSHPTIRRIEPFAQPEPAPQYCPNCGEELTGRIVSVHSSTGAGMAQEDFEYEPMFKVCIPERFFIEGLIVFKVEGDSMEPTISEGALVGVNTTEQRIIGGKIFAVWVPYEGVTLKRVFVDPENNILLLQSENPKHPDQRLPIDGRENLIVGRVKWVMQEV
jgi:phage repressor protein C with HTH and peptisase S24 domain